jgi:hypothetical protein
MFDFDLGFEDLQVVFGGFRNNESRLNHISVGLQTSSELLTVRHVSQSCTTNFVFILKNRQRLSNLHLLLILSEQ